MTTEELRIGNFVLHCGEWQVVHSIDQLGINIINEPLRRHKLQNLSPIPLTPEILQMCGFKKTDNSNEYWSFYRLKDGWYVSLSHHNEPSAGVEEGYVYYGDEYIKIPSLHRLQNLYNSLTNKEIILQP